MFWICAIFLMGKLRLISMSKLELVLDTALKFPSSKLESVLDIFLSNEIKIIFVTGLVLMVIMTAIFLGLFISVAASLIIQSSNQRRRNSVFIDT